MDFIFIKTTIIVVIDNNIEIIDNIKLICLFYSYIFINLT